jgi:hypothetical protein
VFDQAEPRKLAAKIASVIDEVTPCLAEPDPVRAAELKAVLNRLRQHLHSPLRVALVGRVNAGKSTLLNALVGERIAPTNNTECTQVVTWYKDGAPKRLEVKELNGPLRRVPLTATQQLPDQLGLPPDQIDYGVVHVSAKSLKKYEVIDTPGLGGRKDADSGSGAPQVPIGEAATRRALIDHRDTPDALPKPDITILLCNQEPKPDELAFLRDMGASRVDTLALLSHADTFGEGVGIDGSSDPIAMAAEHAGRVQKRHASTISAVVPVAALLAETALAGHLREDDARALAKLSEAEDFELDDILGGGESPVSPNHLDRLECLLGMYGIVRGRKLADKGAKTLCDWLERTSGLEAVRREITTRFVARSEVLKGRHVLAELEKLAVSAPGRTQIKTIIENARLDPAMHALRELHALEVILRWDNTHPLVERLDKMSTAGTDAARLGLDHDADAATICSAAKDACLDCRRQRHVAFAAAEKEAWTVLETSYQRIFQRWQVH